VWSPPPGCWPRPTLIRLITTGQIDAKRFITHHFDLDHFDQAYDVFARAADTSALKVVLTRGSEQR
jgi:alcohol dehydrogenase